MRTDAKTARKIGALYFDENTILEVKQLGGGGAGVGGANGLNARNLVTGEDTGEVIAAQAGQIEQQGAQIDALTAQNTELQAENTQLQAANAELAERLKNSLTRYPTAPTGYYHLTVPSAAFILEKAITKVAGVRVADSALLQPSTTANFTVTRQDGMECVANIEFLIPQSLGTSFRVTRNDFTNSTVTVLRQSLTSDKYYKFRAVITIPANEQMPAANATITIQFGAA